MARKQPMTLDEYREMGRELKLAREIVIRWWCRMGASGAKNRPALSRLYTVINKLDEVRNLAENEFYRDFPDEFSPHVFYGAREDNE